MLGSLSLLEERVEIGVLYLYIEYVTPVGVVATLTCCTGAKLVSVVVVVVVVVVVPAGLAAVPTGDGVVSREVPVPV